MSRIDTLTLDQQAFLRRWHSDWLQVGFETKPADRTKAESVISTMYDLLGKPHPRFIWVDSPATASLAIYVLKYSNQRASLGDSLRASLGASLGASLRASLWASLGDSLGDSLYWGQHESAWIAYYLFCAEIGTQFEKQSQQTLTLWSDLAKSTGWWIPYTHIVVCCERQREIHIEPTRQLIGGMPTYRLHAENGPTLKFADGWAVYALHGVRVPKQYVLSPADSLDPAEILKEPNAQVRMAVISKIGFARMLGKLPHKVISSSRNTRGVNRDDALIEFALGNNLITRGLHVWWKEKSGEEKETVIPVWRTKEQFGADCPDNIDDCEQVRRWAMRLPGNVEIVTEI